MEISEEECKGEESLPENSFISREAAKSLLDLLVDRGYLHNVHGFDPIQTDPQRGNPQSKAAAEECIKGPILSPEDPACRVVFLLGEESAASYCCTYDVLEKNLRSELESRGGRCTTKGLIGALRLHNENPILRIVERCKGKDIFQSGDEVISSKYFDRVAQEVFDSLLLKSNEGTPEKERGLALVADLASRKLHLPMDMTVKFLNERLPHESIQMMQLEAGATLVSKDYLKRHRIEVLRSFADLKDPIAICDLCHGRHWDAGLVASWVQEACQNWELSGTFHGVSNATSIAIGSMYTPSAHVEAQRQAVNELFKAQGYMTASRGAALGLSKSKIGQYIKELFPSATIVSETLVVSAETILRPLEAMLQEAITINSFVDLQEHLPADVLEQDEDTKLILNHHVMPALLKNDSGATSNDTNRKKKASKSDPSVLGVVVLSASGGIWVSQGMMRTIQKQVMPGLISEYARERARDMDVAEVAGESIGTLSSKAKDAKKNRRKGKKGSTAASQEDRNEEQSEDVVPLARVVKAIGTEYPALLEADLVTKEALEAAEGGCTPLPQFTWERKTDGSKEGISGDATVMYNESLICELCRAALYDEDLLVSCHLAIQVELKSLQSARLSKATVSRKDAATKVRNVESSFEEAFVDACSMLGTQAKFLKYVESGGGSKELVDKLTKEFLQGCCADFTSRLTQYSLFKNEVDPSIFKFGSGNVASSSSDQNDGHKGPGGALPGYCLSPDFAVQYAGAYLSLNVIGDNENESKVKDPLSKLREVLPGSVGIALARQWVLCGGSCYQGGTKVDESGKEYSRPGDMGKFLAHVEENCLTICGLPFRQLDKKTEKQFLFARRQRLLHLLEAAPKDDATSVLDLTVMLLFQQVKGVVTFGSSFYPDILNLLTSERKIEKDVADVLTKLSQSLASAVDIALIDLVRECGLCRDISKHRLRVSEDVQA